MTQQELQSAADLVAIGGITLPDNFGSKQQQQQQQHLHRTDAAPPSGRLVDRIASSLDDETTHRWPHAAANHSANNKLDYIIEFMRANKLTKFCDLLTSSEAEIRNLSSQLNSLHRFTLFVPTNEALLLPLARGRPDLEQVPLFEQLRSEPRQMKQFLMAHATSELVVPRLDATGWTSGRAGASTAAPLASSSVLLHSLAGSPMRVITSPVEVRLPWSPSPAGPHQATATRLELIVNGANVLGGHSHALQEPNNSSATYAIVHLIDRSLYPAPSSSLMELMRRLAPRWADFLERAQEPQLVARLEQRALEHGQPLISAFIPDDDAFKASPGELLRRLDTNQTFLRQFVRAHLADGLYFSGQLGPLHQGHSSSSSSLAASVGQLEPSSTGATRRLTSLANQPLEFQTKSLQSRQLILVNLIPIIEPDLMALNGVIHLISRPIFERHLLEACNCSSNLSALRTTSGHNAAAPGSPHHYPDPHRLQTLDPLARELELNQAEPGAGLRPSGRVKSDQSRSKRPSNWFGGSPASVGPSSSLAPSSSDPMELEREESVGQMQRVRDPAPAEPAALILDQSQPGAATIKTRAQRSGSLVVTRNNRDFYRPSAAPANLQLDQQTASAPLGAESNAESSANGGVSANGASGQRQPSNPRRGSSSSIESPGSGELANPLFEVERYKIVLNATSRQKLREQQLLKSNLSSTEHSASPSSAAPVSRSTNLAPDSGVPSDKFAYDQPLQRRAPAAVRAGSPSEQSTGQMASSGNRLQYAPAQPDAAQFGSLVNGRRLMLKFEPDDAVIMRQPSGARASTGGGLQPMAGDRLQTGGGANSTSTSWPSTGGQGLRHSQMAVASSASVLSKVSSAYPNEQLQAKTAPPGASFGGCAFYDTECKRIVGRLSQLAILGGPGQQKSFRSLINATSGAGVHQQVSQAPTTTNLPPLLLRPASDNPHHMHLDSTFGETTENPLAASGSIISSSATTSGRLRQQPSHQSGASENLSRPPSGWRLQALDPSGTSVSSDITRIKGPATGGAKLHQQHQLQAPVSAQILLVPVRLFQETGVALPASAATTAASSSQSSQLMSNHFATSTTNNGTHHQVSSHPTIYFGSSSSSTSTTTTTTGSQQTASSLRPPFVISNGQYHAPTLRPPTSGATIASSASLGQALLGGPFRSSASHQQQSNFTPFEPTSYEYDRPPSEQTAPTGAQYQLVQQPSNLTRQPLIGHGLKSPVRVMVESSSLKLPVASQQSTVGEPQLSSGSPIKEARKLFRQEQQQRQQHHQDHGDISVTFAKLSTTSASIINNNNNNNLNRLQPPGQPQRAANYTFNGLATQASNQEPSGANFVRTLAGSSGPDANQFDDNQLSSGAAADFFQNRTIAEIMDDSGLRIDGQQVTFGRLKDCLAQADLLSVVTQPDSSLTIFMPTDVAFQRLVQQQAIEHQQARATRSSGSTSRPTGAPASVALSRRHLIPLIAKSPGGVANVSSQPGGGAGPAGSPERLTATRDLAAAASSASMGAASGRLTLDCSSPQVRQLLLDHLSARLITPRQLTTDLAIASLSGKQLLLSSVPSKKIVVVDGQPVVAATRAKNGMVYVINKFLNMTQQVSNVVQLMEAQPNLSTFLSYLTFSSLADRLKREPGPITVLAPTNEAFEQLSPAARQLINSDPSALADILRGHVVEGAQFGKLVSMRNRLRTMNGDQTIEARVVKPNVYQLDNQLTSIKLIGTTGNGVVNAIERLIVPAWLRVSAGSRGSGSGSGAGAPAGSAVSGRAAASSLAFGDINSNSISADTSQPTGDTIASLRLRQQQQQQQSISNNNSRPVVSFEQPLDADRLVVPARAANSFSLASSNNLLDPSGFDDPTTTTTKRPGWPVAGGADEAGRGPARSSPFLRLAQQAANDNNNVTWSRDSARPRTSHLSAGTRFSGSVGRPASWSPFDQVNNNNNSSSSGSGSLELALKQQNGGNQMSRNMQLIVKLAGLMKTSKFASYLLRSRLNESLKADMNYVILVPTDEAVDKLPRQIIELLERDPERLQDLVNYHVLDTTFDYINTIPDGQTLNSLNEKDILFNWHRNNSVLTASGALVLRGIQEDNIALLIVDRVLYPTPGDLLAIVSKSPILSKLTQLIRSAKLGGQLSLAGPFTLFAPSDLAFQQLQPADLDFLSRSPETARRFLLRHLSQPAVFTSSIALSGPGGPGGAEQPAAGGPPGPSMTISNSLGEELVLRQRNDYFSVNDVNFSYADVAATNGVIHVIDGLL